MGVGEDLGWVWWGQVLPLLTDVLHEYHRDPMLTMIADIRKGTMSASGSPGGASCVFFAVWAGRNALAS